jgi:hypothetical protein
MPYDGYTVIYLDSEEVYTTVETIPYPSETDGPSRSLGTKLIQRVDDEVDVLQERVRGQSS